MVAECIFFIFQPPSRSSFCFCFLSSVRNELITKNLQALFALTEMSSCGCGKECLSNRCKYFKNDLGCTDLCKSMKEKRCRKRYFYIEPDNDE